MNDVLEALQETLEARKSDGAENSYVASLYAQGLNKILEKVGEEATETVLAAKDYDGTDAARSAVAQACLETQKSETDAAKAALHDSLEEIESLYQELEQIACAKDGV